MIRTINALLKFAAPWRLLNNKALLKAAAIGDCETLKSLLPGARIKVQFRTGLLVDPNLIYRQL
jgi:hypothetical protein